MKQQVNVTDVVINKLEIYSSAGKYDLRPHIAELNIYENIHKPALSANIVLSDSHNIPYKLPIVGQETVDIDIVLTGFSDANKNQDVFINPPPLHVTSISSRFFSKPKAQVFTLELVSEQYIGSIHSKISKSYKDKKISDIVADIYYKYLHSNNSSIYIEPTERIENIIIPNLSPTDAIAWLCQRAIQIDGVAVNYLYYETMRSCYFNSINSLAEKADEPIFTYYLRPRVDDPTGVSKMSVGQFAISKLTFLNQFDKIKNIQRGIHSSKLITHDIVTKKITQYEYNGFNAFVGISHFGKFPPLMNSEMETQASRMKSTSLAPRDNAGWGHANEHTLSDMTDSKVEFYPKHNQMYARNAGEQYDNKVEEWKLQRAGNIGIYDGITLLLEVSGNSALRVGMGITVIIPSPETTDLDNMTDKINDKFLSGTYLVTAIQHVFSRIGGTDPKISYTMKIEVVKDSVEDVVTGIKSRKED